MQATEPVDPGPGTVPLEDEDRTLLPKVEIELQVREGGPNGPVRETRGFAANLATEIWVDAMQTLFEGHVYDPYNTNGFSATARDGASHTVKIWGRQRQAGTGRSQDQIWTNTLETPSHQHEIAIGDGGGQAVDPDRTNTDLDNRIAGATVDQPVKAGGDAFAVSATIPNDTGAAITVREVGVFFEWSWGEENSNRGTAFYLCFHDAVSSLQVDDGDAVTVQYTLRWP